jgi:hypothetical protein
MSDFEGNPIRALIYQVFSDSGEMDIKLSAVDDEAIMEAARTTPMPTIKTWFGSNGQIAIGNTRMGYEFYDADDNRLSDEEAKGFRLLGSTISLSETGELTEEQPDASA